MQQPLREIFGLALAELGDENANVIVLDADLANATRSIYFWKKHPSRFLNVGIAEANMVSIAAGLATCGKIPFACTFSSLISLRVTDQVQSQLSYPNLNVKLVGTNGGLTGFGDGVTHQSIMDLAIFRSMPNFTILVPSDTAMVQWAIKEAVAIQGPVYIRIPRIPAPDIHEGNMDFTIGRGIVHRTGKDLSLISMGLMVHKAIEAATALKSLGISAEVIEIHTLKPFDTEMIARSLRKTGAGIVIEEHSRYDGLCSAVAEASVQNTPALLDFVAINDRFASSGEYDEILQMVGLTVETIIRKSEEVLSRKKNKK